MYVAAYLMNRYCNTQAQPAFLPHWQGIAMGRRQAGVSTAGACERTFFLVVAMDYESQQGHDIIARPELRALPVLSSSHFSKFRVLAFNRPGPTTMVKVASDFQKVSIRNDVES